MSTKVFNIIIKMVKEGGADKETIKGLVDIKNTMVAGMAVVGGLTAAYYALDKGLQATVGKFATYAKGVDVFSSALSTTTEEGSRLIQMADDFGISSDEMQASMFRAVKNGMLPTVAGLASMADKYNALATPQEKADFLAKNFGKSSQELTRLLGEGSQALQDRAAAVNDNLVMDAAAIQKAREFEAAQDDLNDAFDAAKISLGEKFIPSLTKLMNTYVETLNMADLYTAGQKAGLQVSTDFWTGQIKLNGEFVTYKELLDAVRTATEGVFHATQDLNASTGGFIQYTTQIGPGLSDAEAALEDFTGYLKGTVQSLNDVGVAALIAELSLDGSFTASDAQQVLNYEKSLGMVTDEEYAARAAAVDMQVAIDAMHDKGITITTTWIDYYMASQAPKYSVGRGGTVQQKASGGQLPLGQGFAEVGEAGTEGISPTGVVIPHGIWEQLKHWIKPGRRLGGGGPLLLAHPLEDPGGEGWNPYGIPGPATARGETRPSWVGGWMGVGATEEPANLYGPSGSSSGSTSTVPMLQATQTVSAAAVSISASGERTAQATQQNTAQSNASSAETNKRLASIELLLSQLPKDITAALARTISL